MPMKAGLLRNLVQVQSVELKQNSFGEAIQTWNFAGEVNAAIDSLAGRELYAAQQIHPLISTKVMTRYFPIKAKDQIIFQDRTLNVEWVNNLDQRKITTVCYCREETK